MTTSVGDGQQMTGDGECRRWRAQAMDDGQQATEQVTSDSEHGRWVTGAIDDE